MIFLLAQWIGVVTSLPADLARMMVYPRIDDYTLLQWSMAVYLSCNICLTWFFVRIIRQAIPKLKLYASE